LNLSSLAVSYDGLYIFSAGGSDMCVNMWIVGVPANDDPAIERDDIADYVTLLENDGSCNLYDDVRLNSIIDNFNICDISW
jgi:hypothetical protein